MIECVVNAHWHRSTSPYEASADVRSTLLDILRLSDGRSGTLSWWRQRSVRSPSHSMMQAHADPHHASHRFIRIMSSTERGANQGKHISDQHRCDERAMGERCISLAASISPTPHTIRSAPTHPSTTSPTSQCICRADPVRWTRWKSLQHSPSSV